MAFFECKGKSNDGFYLVECCGTCRKKIQALTSDRIKCSVYGEYSPNGECLFSYSVCDVFSKGVSFSNRKTIFRGDESELFD